MSAALAADVHRTGAADAFAAGPAEGEGRVDLVFDLDERVEHHRPAGVEVDENGSPRNSGARNVVFAQ